MVFDYVVRNEKKHIVAGVRDRRSSAAVETASGSQHGTHKHPKVQRWPGKHRRFQLHFTPTGASWMSMVEIWSGILTNQAIRRASFDSVAQLKGAIEAFLLRWNEVPKPFVWTKTAEQILAKAVG